MISRLIAKTAMPALALCIGAVSLFPLSASAEEYPSRPIKIIVPYAPGGTDLEVRAVGAAAEGALKQPFQIEIREGGGSTIGANAVAKGSAPDGYTLLYANSVVATVAPQMRKLPYSYEDLRPVAQTTSNAHLLAIRADLPYKTLPEMLDHAKKNPGAITFGSTGTGAGAHLAFEAFADAADVKINHIPFNGVSQSVAAAVGGNVDFIIGYPIAIMPHVKSGKLIGIAQFSSERSPLLPDVPTLREAGVDLVINIHTGIFAPAKTPDAIVARLSEALKVAIDSQQFKDFGASRFTVPFYRSTVDFARAIQPELMLYKNVIARLGAR